VLNVVDFGCFVDIGMHDSGLVHVSRLADKFIRDPHDVVAVGDIVRVWVMEIDKERRRVSLTMVQPGSERPKPQPQQQHRPRHDDRPRQQKPAGDGAPQPKPTTGGRPGGRPQGAGPHGHGRPQHQQYRPRPAPPKPLIPITDGMKAGKEPMRTFGDLLQFYKQKETPDDHQPPAKQEKPKPVAEPTPAVEEPSPPAQDAPAEE
jgi:uncharacterized protein